MLKKSLDLFSCFIIGLGCLIWLSIWLPMENWFHLEKWAYTACFKIVPLMGMALLPVAIYQKKPRHTIIALLFIVAYFLTATLAMYMGSTYLFTP
ncbi:TPA: hypothetical protein ACHVE4_000768 [Streptococcus suis]